MKKNNVFFQPAETRQEIFIPAAEPFAPHQFQTAMVHLNHLPEPKVFVTPEAYADMTAIAMNSGRDEIGWLGTVTQLGHDYLIDKVFMVKQEVHTATSKIMEDGLGELFTELATTDFKSCEKMHFWGHVHPGNSTSPSGQDEEQMSLFAHNDFFVRGIFGRNCRAEFTVFDYKNQIRWNDVGWSIYAPAPSQGKIDFWKKEVEEKVSAIHFEFAGVGNFPHEQFSGFRKEGAYD
jgi:hypothetical protein